MILLNTLYLLGIFYLSKEDIFLPEIVLSLHK